MITVESEVDINTIDVYDVTGKKVISLSTNGRKVKVNMEQLASGIYMIKINNLHVVRIVKQ